MMAFQNLIAQKRSVLLLAVQATDSFTSDIVHSYNVALFTVPESTQRLVSSLHVAISY